MKTAVESPEQKLQGKLIAYKKRYNDDVKYAKQRYQYDTSDLPTKVKIIDKCLSSEDSTRRGQSYYDSERSDNRLHIARQLLGKAHSIKADVGEGHYLSMTSFKLSKTHYSITFWVRKGIHFRYPSDFAVKPTPEQVLAIAKSYFPTVKIIG